MLRFDDADLLEWRLAYGRGELRQGLVAFVSEVAAAAAATGSIGGLSPTGRWDRDSISEAVQGFWAERLVGNEALDLAFEQTKTIGAFAAYLERSLRNFLIDEARRDGSPRLRARIMEALKGEQFECFAEYGARSSRPFGLRAEGWAQLSPYSEGEQQLLSELYALEVVEIARSSSELRADVVIGNPDLLRLLEKLFEAAGAWLTPDQLGRAFEQRFLSYYRPETVSTEEDGVGEISDRHPGIASTLDAAALARRVLSRLSPRQISMIGGRLLENRTFEELGEIHGCSRGTADNEVRRASEVMRELVLPDEAMDVWKAMLDISFREISDPPSPDRP
jgi:DNA-directed RNA polymerase specialized sigma24 family protein